MKPHIFKAHGHCFVNGDNETNLYHWFKANEWARLANKQDKS